MDYPNMEQGEPKLNAQSQSNMLAYYEKVASEYDQVYCGKGPAMSGCSVQYCENVERISAALTTFGNEHLIDIACGPGFWAPNYTKNVTQITFLDQAKNMLEECRNRIALSGLSVNCNFLHGDFFTTHLEPSTYNCALVGLLLSHLTHDEEVCFFKKLKAVLKPQAELFIFDSRWTTERARHHKNKEGLEKRTLMKDGSCFEVYKRYFKEDEFKSMVQKRGFVIHDLDVGDVFIAARAKLEATRESL